MRTHSGTKESTIHYNILDACSPPPFSAVLRRGSLIHTTGYYRQVILLGHEVMFLQVGGLIVGMVSGNWPKRHRSSSSSSSSFCCNAAAVAVLRCFVRVWHCISEVIKLNTLWTTCGRKTADFVSFGFHILHEFAVPANLRCGVGR